MNQFLVFPARILYKSSIGADMIKINSCGELPEMDNKIQPSNAFRPDLDWSQVRETVLMLNLAVSHIERAMRDGDDSVTTLADLFMGMVDNTRDIGNAVDSLPESDGKTLIAENCREISEKMNTAIVAFQFYDKLVQRLTHACNSLAALAELIGDAGRLYNPFEWSRLQEMIRSKYVIDADRKMFDAILNGATVEEALALEIADSAPDPDDNVEFF